MDEFNYERDTKVWKSCSTVMMGIMWIFGGEDIYMRRLSLVGKCGLRRLGTLPFDLLNGAANTVDGSNGSESALLCFDFVSDNVCHS